MTQYNLNDQFTISGVQLSMLYFLTGFDEQAKIIVNGILEQKVDNHD